ncbi:MAG: zinc-ribbon domain-containing protein [Thermoanaerobaculia bacterium]
MFCTKCGSANAPDARFCAKCGGAISGSLPKPVMKRPALITVIAVLHFIFDPILIVGAFAMMVSPGASSEDRIFAIVTGAVMLLLALAGFIGAIGMWKLKAFGRTIQIVLSAIGLLAIPLGTLISAAILWYLFTPPVKVLFSGKRAEQLTPQEIVALQPGAGGGAPVVVVVVILGFAVVAFIGILAAIAIPNLLTAMQRAKQKRTMADMRSIALEIDRFATDNNQLPQADDIQGLKTTVATYANIVTSDGWASEMRYGTDGTNYWLISAGKDAMYETDDPRMYGEGATTNFDCDIVFVNGQFVRYPEGTPVHGAP